MTTQSIVKLSGVIALGVALSACGAADRLANVGQAPALSPIEDPTATKGYKPVQMPMPAMEHASFAPNSLWRTGSRAFFKDQRARLVGDLVTVKVKVTPTAPSSTIPPSAAARTVRISARRTYSASRTRSTSSCPTAPSRARC
jgi:flagellar L-ring protein precursor FlgH